jgi:hypothetical protein
LALLLSKSRAGPTALLAIKHNTTHQVLPHGHELRLPRALGLGLVRVRGAITATSRASSSRGTAGAAGARRRAATAAGASALAAALAAAAAAGLLRPWRRLAACC